MNATTHSPQARLLAQLGAIPACQIPIDGSDWFPPVDIVEDAEEYLFKIDLPEVTPDNLQVAVEADELVISGERANPWQEDRKVLRVERPHGCFVPVSLCRRMPNHGTSALSSLRAFSKSACGRWAPVRGRRPQRIRRPG